MTRNALRALGTVLLGALAVWMAGAGCAGDPGPLAPAGGPPRGDATSFVASGDESTTSGHNGSSTVDWTVVASRLVSPTQDDVVAGSRYELIFPRGSLDEAKLITISEHDPHIADVEFGPDGTQFKVPVQVVIDYRDTALDPDSPRFRGIPIRAFWFNPERKEWEPIPFTADKVAKQVRFEVTHFSRYGLSDAVTEGEWQWHRSGRHRSKVSAGGRN